MNNISSTQSMTPLVVQLQKAPPEQSWIEVGHGVESWLAAVGLIIGAAWALFGDWRKTRTERERDRELVGRETAQRERQLRWDQAKLAKEINDEFLDDKEVRRVLGLVDTDGDTCELTDFEKTPQKYTYDLAKGEHLAALRIDTKVTDKKDTLLRDCFDAWFYWMSLMEQYLQNRLILPEDIAFPSDYYLHQLRSDSALYRACSDYIAHHKLSPNIAKFMTRFID